MIDVFRAEEIAAEMSAEHFEKRGSSSCYVAVSAMRGRGIVCPDWSTAVGCDCKYVFRCDKEGDDVDVRITHAYQL